MSDKIHDNATKIIPPFFYGTAWKEEQTQSLTELALQTGFRGIDTANQRMHYYEAAVGEALAAAIASGLLTRDDLFLQTKFTFRRGQDHRLPYDPAAPIATQVQQSFASSQEHLGTEFIDSYVLHGPSQRSGWNDVDWEAWRAMEALVNKGLVGVLGVSNVSLDQLQILWEDAKVKPRFVQNRCFAVTGWDREIREFCSANDLIYQGFSLLTANRHLADHPAMTGIANRYGRTTAQIIFRFALDVGMLPLTGTTSAQHMREDLDVVGFSLEPAEIQQIETMSER